MGIKLSELGEGSRILLQIRNKEKYVELGAVLRKHVKNNIALITLDRVTPQKLVFDNVQIDMEYSKDGDVPFIWRGVKVVAYQTAYLLQVFSDGVKHNRRDYFRVGISKVARLGMIDNGPRQAMIRDLSLSGFSISDRKKELKLNIGDEISVFWEDIGHNLNLRGRVVRIEDQEDVRIFGLEICNLCKDLSSYVNMKQRQNNK